MKKKFLTSIILALSLVGLTACVMYNGRNKDGSPKGSSQNPSSEPASSDPGSSGDDSSTPSSSEEPVPQGDVKLYLVLGPHGRIDGNPGDEVPAKFLENTFVTTVAIGSDLPKADRITTNVTGSSFSHWVNRETTETVSKAPATESVLVAVFTGGDGSNTPAPSSGIPSSGFGFLFVTAPGADPYYKVGEDQGEVDVFGTKYHQYHIQDFQLIEGQQFQLYDFGSTAGWVVPLDPYSVGANGDASKVAEYITISGGYYVVQKTFDAKDIYIKLLYEHDNLYIGKK